MTFETKKSLRKQLEAAIASAEGYQSMARNQERVSSKLREETRALEELVLYLAAEMDILRNYTYVSSAYISGGSLIPTVSEILRDHRRIKDARGQDSARRRLTPPSKDEE